MGIRSTIKDYITFEKGVKLYRPKFKEQPGCRIETVSAWAGHELIIADILKRFKVERNLCLEFGVEFGFSTVAFSSYFRHVVGVDTFQGDEHAGFKGNHFETTAAKLSEFQNIELVRSTYQDFVAHSGLKPDLCHVDIIHTYEDTFACGLWCAERSKVTLFHDTESYPEVRAAVKAIAVRLGKTFYNYKPYSGLGIVV